MNKKRMTAIFTTVLLMGTIFAGCKPATVATRLRQHQPPAERPPIKRSACPLTKVEEATNPSTMRPLRDWTGSASSMGSHRRSLSQSWHPNTPEPGKYCIIQRSDHRCWVRDDGNTTKWPSSSRIRASCSSTVWPVHPMSKTSYSKSRKVPSSWASSPEQCPRLVKSDSSEESKAMSSDDSKPVLHRACTQSIRQPASF